MLRTGTDFDHLHPNCIATITANCIPLSSGIDGDVLQISGPADPMNPLHNDCPTTTAASPRNTTVLTREITLDGTASMSGDGKSLTFV